MTTSHSAEKRAARPGADVHPDPPQRHEGRTDPARNVADGEVAPDVRARAPGRGAWIGVDRVQLDAASAKGKLKSALQRAFKTNEIQRSRRPRRAGRASAPSDGARPTWHGSARKQPHQRHRPIATAARSGKVHMLLHAADAGEDGRRRWTRRGGSAEAKLRGDIPRGTHYLVHGTGPRECGTRRPDRSRCRFACPPRACPVASFHWPRSRS